MRKTTPMLEQYWRIKSLHKDRILLFRLGDFFEMFSTDAEKATPILNIVLTKRHKGTPHEIAMCGIPHHSISGPISKLLSSGLSVAICDQVEEASNSDGLVKRAVTRVLSPGMVYDPETLNELQANYMAAFEGKHIGFLDASTGEGFYYEVENREDMLPLLYLLNPVELVIQPNEKEKFSATHFHTTAFDVSGLPQKTREISHSFIKKRGSRWPECVQTLIQYALFMQGESVLKVLNDFEYRSRNQEMYLSSHLLEHLEVFKNSDGSSKDTLFSTINRTKTPVGARLLKKHLSFPLKEKESIEKRLNIIEWWISHVSLLKVIRKELALLGDSERKLNKVTHSHCNGRDLMVVAQTLKKGLSLEQTIGKSPYEEGSKKALEITDKIFKALKEEPSLYVKDGGVIKKGFHPELDKWMDVAQNAGAKLLDMEQKERVRTKISSLKIRYNNVFGYYIEVRKTHTSKVPGDYVRKQTLVSSERYTIEALSTLEGEILSARSKQVELEEKLFKELRLEILEALPVLLKLCGYWGRIDVFSSLAYVAIENNYVKPQFGSKLLLVNSRHPVLERKSFKEFVPNTIDMEKGETLILTGPNMGGKSTLMRQAALSVLLAQSGCYVPATEARLPVFHKMFTRMGAGDSLTRGLSTFMLEMKETNEILQKSDSNSLVLLDEIGRGTATFDGMSLAQALLEFLVEEKKPIVFSATHYHELTGLASNYSSVKNGSLSVEERENEMRFLYTLQDGPAGKSYGIEVARLSGLPPSVLKRAKELLKVHELNSNISARNLTQSVLKKQIQESDVENKMQTYRETTLKKQTHESMSHNKIKSEQQMNFFSDNAKVDR